MFQINFMVGPSQVRAEIVFCIHGTINKPYEMCFSCFSLWPLPSQVFDKNKKD